MRFNIHGFRQDKAIEFGLNNDELLILRHFEDFATSGKMDTFYKDGHMFYWVNYDAFLKHLPILDISKQRLGDVMIHNLGEIPLELLEKMDTYTDKMKDKIKRRKYVGILKNETVRNKEVGVRSYFTFTKKFYELKPDISNCDNEMNTHTVKIPQGSSENTDTHTVKIPQGMQYKYRNKDSSIIDYSIKDSSINTTTNEVVVYAEKNLGRITANNKKELLKYIESGISEELVIRAIDLAIGSGKRTLNYVKGILNNWIKDEIKNSAQLDEHIKKNNNKKITNISIYQNKEKNHKKTRFHNINETFSKYEPDELEKKLLESQRDKFVW